VATGIERLQLLIDADVKGAVTGLREVGAAATAEGSKTQAITQGLSKVGPAALAAGGAIAVGLHSAEEAAQSLADSEDKASAAFGDSSKLDKFAADAATDLGKSKAAALDAASVYGNLGKAAHVGGQQLVSISTDLARRTADLAEQQKTSYSDVEEAIISGLNGRAKRLKELGVDLSNAKLEETAYADGIAQTGDKLNDNQKFLAAYVTILDQTRDAQGFFAKSTDDSGVAAEQASAKFENAKAALGEQLIPVMTEAAKIGGDITDVFNKLPDGLKGTVGAALAVGAGLSIVVGAAGSVVRGYEALTGIFGSSAAAATTTAIETDALAASNTALASSAEAAAAAERDLAAAALEADGARRTTPPAWPPPMGPSGDKGNDPFGRWGNLAAGYGLGRAFADIRSQDQRYLNSPAGAEIRVKAESVAAIKQDIDRLSGPGASKADRAEAEALSAALLKLKGTHYDVAAAAKKDGDAHKSAAATARDAAAAYDATGSAAEKAAAKAKTPAGSDIVSDYLAVADANARVSDALKSTSDRYDEMKAKGVAALNAVADGTDRVASAQRSLGEAERDRDNAARDLRALQVERAHVDPARDPNRARDLDERIRDAEDQLANARDRVADAADGVRSAERDLAESRLSAKASTDDAAQSERDLIAARLGAAAAAQKLATDSKALAANPQNAKGEITQIAGLRDAGLLDKATADALIGDLLRAIAAATAVPENKVTPPAGGVPGKRRALLEGRAAGGPVRGVYEVGERGFELLELAGGRKALLPGRDGTVQPHDIAARTLADALMPTPAGLSPTFLPPPTFTTPRGGDNSDILAALHRLENTLAALRTEQHVHIDQRGQPRAPGPGDTARAVRVGNFLSGR
jgi:hypothetical protein